MAFRVSPGVSIKEIDLTTIVPAVATTPGGYAGYFHWGPVNEVVTVTSQNELAKIFGTPENDNYVDFFSVGNFLAYGNNMQVVRVVGATAYNSHAIKSGTTATNGLNLIINNETDFGASAGVLGSTPATNGVLFASKYPGDLGNSIKVVITNGTGITGASLAVAASLGATFIDMYAGTSGAAGYFAVGDDVVFTDGTQASVASVQLASGTVPGTTAAYNASFGTATTGTYSDIIGVTTGWNAASASWGTTYAAFRLNLSSPLPKAQAAGNTFNIKSVYAKYVSNTATTTAYADSKGGSGDNINVLVLDKDGKWTGTANGLIEKFEALSRASDARKFDGSSNYYRTVINDQSTYVWALSQDVQADTAFTSDKTNWTSVGSPLSAASTVGFGVNSLGLTGSADALADDSVRWSNGWSKFADADAYDVSLLPTGNASATLTKLIVQNLCEKRLDCMAFISPAQTDVVNKLPYEALNSIKTFRDSTLNINSSYAVIDSGWKQQLDTYNNIVRVMPLNPDIAGLVARTEFTNEAWFSPAGFNRGQIKNVVKLPYNATQEAHRDELYSRQVNPVVSFPGQGVILYGDKTAQTKPSAFDRINVRRLFIVLEKAIATASKFFLFEQNDAFTRAQFVNLVTPFLKTVTARRGITDFKVVCDESNNTGEVIDRNEFVADIFVKPTRSINFISLNFIATKTGVSFTEVGG
jgi:hypothetical protein